MKPPLSRNAWELALPGVVTGLGTGLVAGGLAAFSGQSPWLVILGFLGLGIPLAIFGAGYDGLLAAGKVRLAGVAPSVLYWIVMFPIARLIHQLTLGIAMGAGSRSIFPEGILPFLAYHAVLGFGYGIGFLWVHEIFGGWWWPRIADHNPVALGYVRRIMASVDRKAKASRR